MVPRKSLNLITVKIVFYVISLLLLIYIMHYSKTEGFQNGLELFLGNPSLENTLSWCPEKTQLLQWISADKYTIDSKKISLLCKIHYLPYDFKDPIDARWLPILKAKDSLGNDVIIESTRDLSLVKFNNLIYKPDRLKADLDKVFNVD